MVLGDVRLILAEWVPFGENSISAMAINLGALDRYGGVGCRVQGAGCRVQGAGCRVKGAGCRVQGAGCRV